MTAIANDRQSFFALMHVPSGQLMRQHRYSRGYTQQTFPLQPWELSMSPRLFSSERGAKQAANWWLKGETTRGMSGYEGNYDEWLETKERGDRKPGDMVVVAVRLVVVGVVE